MIYFLPKEIEDFRMQIRRFCETNLEKNAQRWDENEEFPMESLKALAEEGILSLGIPRNMVAQIKARSRRLLQQKK